MVSWSVVVGVPMGENVVKGFNPLVLGGDGGGPDCGGGG